LETMSREMLFEHYRRYYQPGNAVLAWAGAFASDELLSRIRDLFEPIPAGALPPEVLRSEPEQHGERQVERHGPGETAFIEVAYSAPRGASDDFFVYLVLESLLTGPSNLNMFGGGISNKISRLYQKLVETDIAVAVGGGLQASIDPFLYQIIITMHPDHTPEEAVAALDAEIARVQQELPDASELARAVKQARALFAYGSESITNQGFWLGFAEMFDSYHWFQSYLDRLAEVTPEDVQRVARQYLQRSKRVVGIYRPNGKGDAA